MGDLSDYDRGRKAAMYLGDPNAATSWEAKRAGGPDFMAGEDTDEPPDWHRGFDDAISEMRR